MAEDKRSEAASSHSGLKKHLGSCHCGAVRFEVEMDLGAGVSRCNCTICTKTAITGGMAKPDAFRLLSGEDRLTKYEWASKTSQRYFCKDCGVHCFGRGDLPELGGAFVSINVNTLEDVELGDLKVVHWDGRHNNWEAGPRETPWATFG